MHDIKLVVSTLNEMDRDLILHGYPQREGRSWLTPARFYQEGLATVRRRFYLFGSYNTVLTAKGKAVKEYLRKIDQ